MEPRYLKLDVFVDEVTIHLKWRLMVTVDGHLISRPRADDEDKVCWGISGFENCDWALETEVGQYHQQSPDY